MGQIHRRRFELQHKFVGQGCSVRGNVAYTDIWLSKSRSTNFSCYFLTRLPLILLSVFDKSYIRGLGGVKFSINFNLQLSWKRDQIASLPCLCFMGRRAEMFAVFVAPGDVEMFNYALKSVSRGGKKTLCASKSLGSHTFVNNQLPKWLCYWII